MNNKIQIKNKTIIMMVGVDKTLKSTTIKDLSTNLKNQGLTTQILDSNTIRQELIQKEREPKESNLMKQASLIAFKELYSRLDSYTSYPINTDVVFVDTTGLSESFRKEISEIAYKNNYYLDVLFIDVSGMKDYNNFIELCKEKEIEFPYSKRVLKGQIDRLNKSVKKTLNRNNYHKVHKIKLKEIFNERNIEVIDLARYKRNTLKEDSYTFIHLNENHSSLDLEDIILDNTIFLGNINEEMFHYLKENSQKFVGDLITDNEEILEEFKSFRHEFLEMNASKYKSFIVTNACAKNEFLGKLNRKALINQGAFQNMEALEIETIMKEESDKILPLHIFSYKPQIEVKTFKNKVLLSANKLVSFSSPYSSKPFIGYGEVNQEVDEKNEVLKRVQEHKMVDISELDEKSQRRLDYIIKNDIQYIGGTISPSDKKDNELEGLESAFEYYKNKGIEEVNLQPKYMGSRCQLYLDANLENCFATSRNGYKIKEDFVEGNMRELFKNKQELYKELFVWDDKEVKTIIFDGELTPWNALGEGLIEKNFRNHSSLIRNELEMLKESNFDEHFLSLVKEYKETDFEKDVCNISKKELIEKYGHNKYSTYKNLKFEIESFVPIDKRLEMLETFEKQVALYGDSKEDLDFKAFRILKIIFTDGTFEIPSMKPSNHFSLVNDDEHITVNLNKFKFDEVQSWYNNLTMDKGFEGIVMKPNVEEVPFSTAPFLKVRNKDYLTITYGYDYLSNFKHNKLLKGKNIHKKLNMSIKQFWIGEEMLKSFDDKVLFKQHLANFLFENSKEASFDPRL